MPKKAKLNWRQCSLSCKYQFSSQRLHINFIPRPYANADSNFFLNQCHLEGEVTTTSFSFYRCTTWVNTDFLVSIIVFTCLCQIFAVSSPSADRETMCLQMELRADKSQCAPHFQITYSLSFLCLFHWDLEKHGV